MRLKISFIFLFCIVNFAGAQYKKFLFDTLHSWRQYNEIWQGASFHAYSYYQIKCQKDTVINSKIYHKIVPFGGQICGPNGCVQSFQRGLLRQDTVAKKIYFYDTFFNKDELLYDFSLNVGDTLKNVATFVMSGGPIKWSYILTNKDSVLLLDGKFYRRHIFSDISTSVGTFTVIESIGSNIGLLTPYFMNANGIDYMICYNKIFPYSTIFSKYGINYCGPTEINENEKQRLVIYPNPSNNNIMIIGVDEVKRLQVFDYLGRVVAEGENSKEIDIHVLNPGIYSINVYLKDNSVITHKLIKE